MIDIIAYHLAEWKTRVICVTFYLATKNEKKELDDNNYFRNYSKQFLKLKPEA